MWTYRHTQVLEITISLDPNVPDVAHLSPNWTPSVNGVLSFTPKDGSYFYEDIGCVSAKKYFVFTLQTSSTTQFMPQVEAGCGAAGTRYNGALVTGTFPNPTNIAIDISSLLTGRGASSIFSIALSSLANTAGSAPWQISNLVVVDRLPCGYSNMLMVTQTSFYWTAPGTTTSLPASSTVTRPLQPSTSTSTTSATWTQTSTKTVG
ncbi:hypothetical protein HKX48_005292 [Thoreauomyces humboldtii]|nr:hypothetical protein HKX48_005292 [Thoreauomyces humboldtii]